MANSVIEVLSILTGTQAKELQYKVVGSVTAELIEKRAQTVKEKEVYIIPAVISKPLMCKGDYTAPSKLSSPGTIGIVGETKRLPAITSRIARQRSLASLDFMTYP